MRGKSLKKSKIETLSEFSDYLCCEIKKRNKFKTAESYKYSVKRFLDYVEKPNFRLSGMNAKIIEAFENQLQKDGVCKNSTSYYMRVLRSIYNQAVKSKIIKQKNPFENVYTGVAKTRKRAISRKYMMKIGKLQVSHSDLELSRDIFLFSYFMRGMAFVDVAFLKKSQIQGDYILYKRRKTNQELQVKMESCIKKLIGKYAASTSDFIFPILSGDDAYRHFMQYKQALRNHNLHLKELSRQLQVPEKLTSYVSRHSWATNAKNMNIPVSVISESMGHDTEKTTMIYLAAMDRTMIDYYNKRVLRGF